MPHPVHLHQLHGLTPYDAALRLQQRWVNERRLGTRPDTLLVLEHLPVITLGRNATAEGIVTPRRQLEQWGIQLQRVTRGGQATYHGPGQVVAYPIVRLRPLRLGVKHYVAALEEAMIRCCALFGIRAHRTAGRPGVFTPAGKIGAVGVAISGGVTYHGLAFNVRTDLRPYRHIIPCGLHDIGATSLLALLGEQRCPSVAEATAALVDTFCRVFHGTLEPPP